MKKIIFILVLMMVTMFTMTSCNSNNEKMFILLDKPVSIDDMYRPRFDTLIVHEQIQPDKSVKYIFECRRSWHDIYIIEDESTVYDKNGRDISIISIIQLARNNIEDIMYRMMKDKNISEDDMAYVEAAYKQIYLNNFSERQIYNSKKRIDIAKNDMVEDPENYDIYKSIYDENIKKLKDYMEKYPDVDTTNIYKLYE